MTGNGMFSYVKLIRMTSQTKHCLKKDKISEPESSLYLFSSQIQLAYLAHSDAQLNEECYEDHEMLSIFCRQL